jgi:hypothetical protein
VQSAAVAVVAQILAGLLHFLPVDLVFRTQTIEEQPLTVAAVAVVAQILAGLLQLL